MSLSNLSHVGVTLRTLQIEYLTEGHDCDPGVFASRAVNESADPSEVKVFHVSPVGYYFHDTDDIAFNLGLLDGKRQRIILCLVLRAVLDDDLFRAGAVHGDDPATFLGSLHLRFLASQKMPQAYQTPLEPRTIA